MLSKLDFENWRFEGANRARGGQRVRGPAPDVTDLDSSHAMRSVLTRGKGATRWSQAGFELL